VKLFKRRQTDPPYLREGEELLRQSGWQRVSGEGSQSLWTSPTGAGWMSFEEAIDELALLAAPDPEEERWI
jgi:hypothetical protein